MTSALLPRSPAGFLALPLAVTQLALPVVLNSGQSFRWHHIAALDEFRFCLRDRVVCLRQSPDMLYYRSLFPDPQPSPDQAAVKASETLAWINDYFQLHIDLDALYSEWAMRDPIFASLKDRFNGIRVLRQDPWENLISYTHSSR
jgi:N-glycosylase/DNA lyase